MALHLVQVCFVSDKIRAGYCIYEGIKDENERSNVFADNKGTTGVEGLGCAAPDERMQMLADIAARAGAESAAQDVIPGSFFGAVPVISSPK